MNFNHEQLIKIEWETGRVVRAVGQFADRPTREVLDKALYILNEVRHAAQFMCDPATTAEEKAEVMNRLADLFKEES